MMFTRSGTDHVIASCDSDVTTPESDSVSQTIFRTVAAILRKWSGNETTLQNIHSGLAVLINISANSNKQQGTNHSCVCL